MPHRSSRGSCAVIKFFQCFVLQMRALWRTRVLPCTVLASAAVVLLAPGLARGDGTADGERQVLVQLALGGVFALVAIVSLITAAGAFADARATRRLALTLTRPVPMCSVWLGKFAAIMLAAAVSLAAAFAVLFATVGGGGDCVRLVPPTLPSIAEEALSEYDRFMAAPDTPKEVKAQPKAAVVNELVKRMSERYDAVRPGEGCRWRFRFPSGAETVVARLRFSAEFDLRTPVSGTFALGGSEEAPAFAAVITNLTRAVLDVPLERGAGALPAPGDEVALSYVNTGDSAVMLRPRHDLFVLVPGDSAAANAVRTVVMLLVILAALVALGLFFSSALSKNVSVFAAAVLIAVTLMAPSVLVQFPTELGTNGLERVGLAVSKVVLRATRAVGELHPVGSFAAGECVEWGEIGVAAARNALLFPLALMMLSAAVLRFRPPED